MTFFEGFREWDLSLTTGATLHGRSGGEGPAVVLLHGHPRAHTTWYEVAPRLAEAGYTVICPDVRGYGRSSKPAPDAAHKVYCAEAKAADTVELAKTLGHDRFAVIGHDRGMGVAYTCALDHPEAVTALGVLDGVPRLEADERVDTRFATEWWHWFFFAGSPHAERVITADPDAWYGLDCEKRAVMGLENFDYVADAIRRPDTIRAMLEDYRAGLTADLDHDREARAEGRKIACPVLVGWSIHDDMEQLYGDPAALWQDWVAGAMTTARIDSGHHMAEENPGQLTTVLVDFLKGQPLPGSWSGRIDGVRYLLTADHEIPERAPLVLEPGDVVRVGDRDAVWPAFVFVTAPHGTGWVPSRHIEIEGSIGTVRVGYDTTELPASSGEGVDVLRDDPESGWSWCRNADGREGWVPHRVLATA